MFPILFYHVPSLFHGKLCLLGLTVCYIYALPVNGTIHLLLNIRDRLMSHPNFVPFNKQSHYIYIISCNQSRKNRVTHILLKIIFFHPMVTSSWKYFSLSVLYTRPGISTFHPLFDLQVLFKLSQDGDRLVVGDLILPQNQDR